MMRKTLLTLIIGFIAIIPMMAQNPVEVDSLSVNRSNSLSGVKFYPNEYLDTVDIKKKFVVNDYSMIGVEYGVSMSLGHNNPSYNTQMLFQPVYAGVTFTHYQKMYGRHPYFGYEVGLFYGKQGYSFTEKSKHTIEGANEAVLDIVEIPLWMAMHFDSQFVKFTVNLGPYGGYRLGIHRQNVYDPTVEVSYKDEFAPADRRFDYGVNGGVGVGFVVAPMELHVNLRTRFSLSELHDPTAYCNPKETNPQWWYTYPWDFTLSVALQFHLSKRTGRTDSALRKEAKQRVMDANNDKR